jgi:hypothetical protein
VSVCVSEETVMTLVSHRLILDTSRMRRSCTALTGTRSTSAAWRRLMLLNRCPNPDLATRLSARAGECDYGEG